MYKQNGGLSPVYERLCQLRGEQLSFHTPGHKQGQRGSELLKAWLPDAVPLDLTEIADLDSIHRPDGPLLRAEQLAADLYGAKATFFTTNGSTAGLIGSLLSAALPGTEVLVPRNAHLSILSAIILGDLLPRFVQPIWQGGRLLGCTSEQLAAMLNRYRGVKTVVLVSPSYQGVVGELERMVRLSQEAGCLVVVDEAHGAHLPFHPKLPLSAVAAGADLVVQSAHKTLSALTGGAWVHRLTDRLTDERVRSCINLVQSTSPSWLILGSLDLARLELAQAGRDKLSRVLQNAVFLRQEIRAAGWSFWDAPQELGFSQDPLKINLSGSGYGYTGAELAHELESRGVYPEMVEADNVLLMLGLGDTENRYEALIDCLRQLPRRKPLSTTFLQQPPLPKVAMRPREAYFSKSCLVSLAQAAGRVAARPLYLYPPGIPLVYPGEIFDSDVVAFAGDALSSGAALAGCRTNQVAVVE